VLDQLLFSLAKRFVAGTTIEQAIQAVQKLNNEGISSTLDVLGENVKEKRAAENALASYLLTLDRIQQSGVSANVSLKLTQMGLDIDRSFCASNLTRICEKAAGHGNFVRIDMEGSRYTEATLTFFHELYGSHRNVGIVIQAYLHRSQVDLEGLNRVRARVRICKGAYREPRELAFQRMSEIRANFKKLASRLLVEGEYPAVATHDDRLISWTKDFVHSHGIGKGRFEFQMLYGVRPETQRQLARQGYRVRVYVPYGTHWLPYFYRRLRERKENVFFVLRNILKS
jgi:proline dehydrogenase